MVNVCLHCYKKHYFDKNGFLFKQNSIHRMLYLQEDIVASDRAFGREVSHTETIQAKHAKVYQYALNDVCEGHSGRNRSGTICIPPRSLRIWSFIQLYLSITASTRSGGALAEIYLYLLPWPRLHWTSGDIINIWHKSPFFNPGKPHQDLSPPQSIFSYVPCFALITSERILSYPIPNGHSCRQTSHKRS